MTFVVRKHETPGGGRGAYRLCITCETWRKVQWKHRDRPDPYICRFCNPHNKKFEFAADSSYASTLRLKYGITLDQYNRMLQEQGGCCAICGHPPKRNRLHVDHDHDTGIVRGLLCTSCNSKLEWMIAYGVAANAYLERGGPILN